MTSRGKELALEKGQRGDPMGLGTAQHGGWQGMEDVPLLMGPKPHSPPGPDKPWVLPMGEPGSGPSLPITFHALGVGSRDMVLPSQVLMGLSPSPGCVCPKQQYWVPN